MFDVDRLDALPMTGQSDLAPIGGAVNLMTSFAAITNKTGALQDVNGLVEGHVPIRLAAQDFLEHLFRFAHGSDIEQIFVQYQAQ